MDGKKSEQGIVVNKLTGKVAKVSDSIFIIEANLIPKRKGFDAKPVCPWKKNKNDFGYRHVPDRSQGGKKAVELRSNRRVDRLGRSNFGKQWESVY